MQKNILSYKDLKTDRVQNAIAKATLAWRNAAHTHAEEHGDQGAICIGDGIEVWMTPKGCRLPRWVEIISSRDVRYYQGEIHYVHTRQVALDILNEADLSVRYNHGRMD